MNPIKPLKSVVLVSTPWPIFNRPSIQLGTLKSYLKSQFPELEIVAHHFYLELAETIGYKLYHDISERTWLAETVYAALLYPERLESIKKLFIKEAKGKPSLRCVDFKDVTKRVAEVTDEFIDNENWSNFGLAGFSICLCQLTSTLYFIHRIKLKFPDLPIVVGGSMFTGGSAKNLLKVFPEIDFVVIGEGELALSRLLRNLKDSPRTGDHPLIPGIVTAKEMNIKKWVGFSQVEHLEGIPVPDYDDYFNLLKSFKPDKTFFPTLPAEISRGCWWKGTSVDGDKNSGCAFCNLNLQWKGYRSKNPDQVVAGSEFLTEVRIGAHLPVGVPHRTSGGSDPTGRRCHLDVELSQVAQRSRVERRASNVGFPWQPVGLRCYHGQRCHPGLDLAERCHSHRAREPGGRFSTIAARRLQRRQRAGADLRRRY